ncbi:diguanylate cyclase domain-containing protein, partial [Duganella callida]
MSTLDPLTGLADRMAFREGLQAALQRSMRGHSHIALVLINLDNFQAINDQHGQDHGDAMLRATAGRHPDIASRRPMPARRFGTRSLL